MVNGSSNENNSCPPNYIQDNFFVFNSTPVPSCSLNLSVYLTLMSCYALLFFIVAIERTQLIGRRRKMFLKSKKYDSKKAIFSYIFILRSFGSVVVTILMEILPFYNQDKNLVMSILLGFQCFFFNFNGERWLTKLIRLGRRIIPKSVKSSGEMSTEEEAEGEVLKQADYLLKLIIVLIRVSIVIQFVFFCILVPLIKLKLLLQFAVGLQAFGGSLNILGIIWQYRRCERVFLHSVKNIEGASQPKQSILIVQRKFRSHQIVIFSFGILGCFTYLLFAVELFSLNYILILLSSFVDCMINAIVLIVKRQDFH